MKLIVNINDEEALKRIINFPQGAWGNHSNKITIESNKLNISDYKFIKDYSKDSKVFTNSTKNKLYEFMVLIESLKIKNE